MRDTIILDFDLGNTRLKWQLSCQSTAQGGSHGAKPEFTILASGASFYEGWSDGFTVEAGKVDRIRIASVVDDERLNSLLAWCENRWQIKPEIASVKDEQGGVSQGYHDKKRLGVDRWLSLLAAFEHHKSGCVVVSCGSAITVDLLSGSGEHFGGYILPGIELMRKALFSGTNAVKLDAIKIPSILEPGRDTVDAVNSGLPLMVKGVIEQALVQLEERGGEKLLLLTGGDGEALSSLFKGRCEYSSSLVFDGLKVALP